MDVFDLVIFHIQIALLVFLFEVKVQIEPVVKDVKKFKGKNDVGYC